ncbi:MAG: DHH family phosphoesterase [Methylomonas sp.]|nr:DHH family phosphoesterase [Methylomonas sp.]
MHFDVFNGDADGICALLQLRLAEPLESTLITGVKRDIGLLRRVNARQGDSATVLDISLDKNRQPLLELLESQVDVFYVDHHQAGEIPDYPRLKAIIDTDADVCTSLLIDRYLNHRFSAWAVVAAFGDNLDDSAVRAAQPLNLSADRLQQLRQLGVYLNYNSYGSHLEDLYFPPDRLFRILLGYRSPFEFVEDRADVYQALVAGYAADMERVKNSPVEYQSDRAALFILPDEAWSRRVSGVWGNDLANSHPHRAHAILSPNEFGGYLVSVRAPLTDKLGADELCSRFPGGGGRKAAAGINHLERGMLSDFLQAFILKFSKA